MAIREFLNVRTLKEVEKHISECEKYMFISAHGITVRVLKNDWVRNTLNAKIAF